jgi:hypothetical protein
MESITVVATNAERERAPLPFGRMFRWLPAEGVRATDPNWLRTGDSLTAR